MQGGLDGPALRPWEIRQLTLPEISAYLDQYGGVSHGQSGSIPFGGNYAELVEWTKRRREMSAMEALEEALQEQ